MPNLSKLSFFVIIFFACALIRSEGQNNISTNDEVQAPRRLERARKAFENMAYPRAIRRYEKLKAKDLLPDSEKKFLALAYLKILKPEKAEEIYSSIAPKNLKGEHLYHYAKALRYNEKYARADSIMALYHSENPQDSRARLQQNTRSFADSIMKQKRQVIEEVDFNSEYTDFAPYMQGGYLYFSSEREINRIIDRETAREKKPYLNIFRVGKQEGRFTRPELFIPNFRTIFHDGPLCFNLYGTEIFITRNKNHSLFKKEDSNKLNIVYAYRLSDGQWSKPVALPFNDPSYSCGHPFLTKDGSRLYFVSDKPGGSGSSDIYYADRDGDTWKEPVNLGGKINTEGNEMFPFIDGKGRLYFASDGHQGLGGLDIFVAEKIDGEYVVKNMGYPVNSEKDDFSLFLQPDGKHGFFASNRPGGTGSDDIYRLEITEPFSFTQPTREVPQQNQKAYNGNLIKQQGYNGRLINRKTREPLSNAIIGLLDGSGAYIKEITTNQQGIFTIPDSISGQITAFTVVDHFYPYEKDFYLESLEDTILLEPEPKPYYGITGTVARARDYKPMPDVTVLIYSESFDTDTTHTNSDGKMNARLNPYTNYQIVFHKQRYIPYIISYSTMQQDTGVVNLNRLTNLRMEEAMPGSSFELKVNYDNNEVSTQEEGINGIDPLVHFLKNNPDIRVEVGVHTDSRGDASTNMTISRKKAESAVQYLTEKGVNASRMTAKGYGESRLKNNCSDGVPCSEEEHRENERMEITILK